MSSDSQPGSPGSPLPDDAPVAPPAPARAWVGWRWLALCYDAFPVIALWFAVASVFVLVHGDSVRGGWLGLLEFVCLWGVTGAYAVLSWRRGGQTLGMRPWRLQVVSASGGVPSWRALWLRYVMGQLSMLAGGLGFWWAWFDRQRLTWHDRASGTRMRRLDRR